MELKLPTLAVPVRLALAGHDAATAELFIPDVRRRVNRGSGDRANHPRRERQAKYSRPIR